MRPALLLLPLLGLAACQPAKLTVKGDPCSPENCGGCCDALGFCLEGTANDACGLEGVACMACVGGSVCGNGFCATPAAPDAGRPDAGDASADVVPARRLVPRLRADDAALRSVWAVSPKDVWAVGDQGTPLHFDGTAWTAVATGAADDFYGVWASGPKDVWVVGGAWAPTASTGVVLRFDGTQWHVMQRGTVRVSAVWGSGPGDVWVVGDAGSVFHWDGTQMVASFSGTTQDLADVVDAGGRAAQLCRRVLDLARKPEASRRTTFEVGHALG